jgi:hypothetical protein
MQKKVTKVFSTKSAKQSGRKTKVKNLESFILNTAPFETSTYLFVGDVNELAELLKRFDVALDDDDKSAGGLFIPFSINHTDGKIYMCHVIWLPKFDRSDISDVSCLSHEISHAVTEMLADAGCIDDSKCYSELTAYMTGSLVKQAIAHIENNNRSTQRHSLIKCLTITEEMADILEV